MKSRLQAFTHPLRLFTKSIRFRLSIWSAAVLAVILLVFSLFIYSRQASELEVIARTRLELKSQQMEVLLRLGQLFESEGDLPPDFTQREGMVVQPNEVLALVNQNGDTLQKLGPINQDSVDEIIQTWQKNQPVSYGRITFYPAELAFPDHGNQKVRYLFLVNPLTVEHRLSGLIILGSPVDPEGQLPKLVMTLLLGSLAVLALVLGGGYWLAARAMAPVRTITRAAREISESDLHRRLNLNTQDELGELANTFDAMLNRLQAAFDRQRQFTADASHELRTPLTIVSLEADRLLERRRTPEEYERALQVIKSENTFMSRLVNDLLTLARMDAGQTQLRLEPLDLSDIALDVVERLSSLARRDGVEIHTGSLPEVRVAGDRQYLTQMLTNLVENAIKYSGGAGHHVTVESGTSGADGFVRVADDGPGIPPEDLPHLFDRFYRVDKARSRRQGELTDDEPGEGKNPEGSGLGLSIVQWIARAHHGQVSVHSEVGKGTLFEVRLPCLPEP